jgi:predicted ATPase
MRRGIAACHNMGNLVYTTLLQTALAEAEAEAGEIETALATIDHAVALTERTGQRWNEADTHRARGEILFKRDPANTEPAENAFLTAIAVAQQQKAKSFELRAALSLAKFYQSTNRAADAHAVLAPALEGFSPTPEFPEIEQALELFAALAATDQIKNAAAARERRLKLQTSYGQAVMWSKGYAAEETKAAFVRAQELTASIENPAERFVAYFAQWAGSPTRGESAVARETAETFCREAENEGAATERVVGLRMLGFSCLLQGDFIEAQAHLEEAIRVHDPERDRDARFRFGQDASAAAFTYLAITNWVLGQVGLAGARIEEGLARGLETNHPVTHANINYFTAILEIVRGDVDAARRASETVVEVSREHGLPQFALWGALSNAWARARLKDRDTGLAELREALEAGSGRGDKINLPLYQGLLAELEAEGQDVEPAFARIEAALSLAAETGEHWTDAFLYRIRGEILLKRDPANTAPAEEAFLTAIAVAQQRKARSFELLAALALAKLYQSTGRAADAHAVLAPGVVGFSPMPEFPEIEQAQTLLAALAETDEVKNAAASRQRQAKLQISYANALIATRGYGAAETAAAFARARELTMGIDDAIERFSVLYGLWVGHLVRGELAPMRETADAFLRDVEMRPMSPEAGIAHRLYALTRWYQGDYADARHHLERALAILDRERDRDLTFRFGQDQFVAAEIFLALALWSLGEVAPAGRLAEAAQQHAAESGQIATLAYMHLWVGNLEAVSGDAARATRHAAPLLALCREHNLAGYATWGALTSTWACARLSGSETQATMELQSALSAHVGLGNKLCVPLYQALLAEIEAGGQDAAAALSHIDEAIAVAQHTGERWTDAFLHRIRGEILLKRDPVKVAPAEEAFLTAIAVAQQQKARSFELRAALSLAKLYQSTGRAADAHAVLAPALEGFSPTPEFPEIAEAQALLAALPL